jgi:hypothetical protein
MRLSKQQASPRLRQLFALAHAIKQRTNKKPVANAWFAKAKAMLESRGK